MIITDNKIKTLRKEHSLTQTQLAEQLGIATNTVCQYERGTRQVPDEVKLKLADFFGVTVDYLLGRQGENAELVPIAKAELSNLPIVGVIKAGTPIFAEENILGYEPAEDKYREGHFYLRVMGNSMSPLIKEGSLALIKRQDYAAPNQIVVALLDGGNATLKRYKPLQGGIVLLQAENPESESYTITATDFISGNARILGVVVKVSYYL